MMEERKRSGRADIFYAISHGKVRQIGTILSQNGECVDSRYTDGKTPLIFAVCEAKDNIRTHLVRMLVRNGSDVNAVDENCRTALMYAAMDHEKIDLVRVLARCSGCDTNLIDFDGTTAVMHAVMSANASAIRILVNSSHTKNSIDLNIKNSQGLNALELSIKLQMSECCRVLVGEGGANTKAIKNQVGLLRLLEDENLVSRSNTPHSRNRGQFMNAFRSMETPIPENKQFEGTYMSRDTTPNYVDEFTERVTPSQGISRSNSLHRTNSNLYRRRAEVMSRPSSFTPNDFISAFNSQRTLKRALTPIGGRNGPSPVRKIEIADEQASFEQRTRLPSIPSGRKLYLVSSSPNQFNGYEKSHKMP